MQLKRILLLSLLAGTILAQQWHVESVAVRGGPPLHSPTCKHSHFGYIHVGARTKLTSAEIGDYVVDAISDGTILTVYPESKDGTFVYAECSESKP